MYRLTFVFSSLLLIAVWSAPIDAAEGQRRARRRDSGTTQTQRAPQRSAPRASALRRTAPARRAPAAGQQRSKGNGGAARRAAPRRAPRPSGSGRVERGRDTRGGQVAPPTNARGSRETAPRGNRAGTAVRRGGRPESRVATSGGDRRLSTRSRRPGPVEGRGRGATRVVAPSTGASSVERQPGRTGSRNRRIGRAGSSRQGTTQVDRRPPGGRVVGTAVRRPPLSSGPVVINNYGGRGGRGYTTYSGRYRHGAPHIYGTSFYFPGYSTFNFGFGVGYGSGYYDPYGYGRYGSYYGYDPYGYGRYGSAYGYYPYAYGGYADAYYTGSLRLKVKPRFGEVFVDGYYVGLVNDYDGIFQRLRLEEGPHHIEIRQPGFEPLEFDVLILPGETITYEGYLIPLP